MIFVKWWKYFLIVILCVVVWWTGWPAYLGYTNTEYSVYYREDRFLDVRIGDDEDYVIGILGEPIAKEWLEGEHIFHYSLPRNEGYFYERKIIFVEGSVAQKINTLLKED